ncbi:MAG: hypothetical protein PUC00_07600, partial [Clostridiales bacterium]|nr:hypothetical protein [Clostridiales bacterium]
LPALCYTLSEPWRTSWSFGGWYFHFTTSSLRLVFFFSLSYFILQSTTISEYRSFWTANDRNKHQIRVKLYTTQQKRRMFGNLPAGSSGFGCGG